MDYVVHLKDSGAFFNSGDEEMQEMTEIILRGLLDDVKDDDIYEGCYHLAQPVFGEDYHEYVYEVIEILRNNMNQEHFQKVQADWNKFGCSESELRFQVLEPHYALINVESYNANSNNGCPEPIRISASIQPLVQ